MTDTQAKKTNPIKKIAKSSFVSEFKEFINRGSVVDLAIGVAVGGAFTAIANSLVNDIIMPVTSLLVGGLDFTTLAIDVPNFFGADTTAHIAYGNFIQNVINFLIIALAIFLIVRTMNKLNRAKEAAAKVAATAKIKEEAEAKVQAESDARDAHEAKDKAVKDAKK